MCLKPLQVRQLLKITEQLNKFLQNFIKLNFNVQIYDVTISDSKRNKQQKRKKKLGDGKANLLVLLAAVSTLTEYKVWRRKSLHSKKNIGQLDICTQSYVSCRLVLHLEKSSTLV